MTGVSPEIEVFQAGQGRPEPLGPPHEEGAEVDQAQALQVPQTATGGDHPLEGEQVLVLSDTTPLGLPCGIPTLVRTRAETQPSQRLQPPKRGKGGLLEPLPPQG